MRAAFRAMIAMVGSTVFAGLLVGSTATELQAQCCGGPGYYVRPYYPPVYPCPGCSPPVWYYPGCSGPVYARPYAEPPATRRPAPYGRGYAPGGDRGPAQHNHQPAEPAYPPVPPTDAYKAAPGQSHSHEQAEPPALVPGEPPVVAPALPQSLGPAERRTTVPSEPQAIAPFAPLPPPPTDPPTLAERQKICPVTGAKLGSMGEPVKVRAKGRDVLLCCQGCVDRFKSDPDKYLAKLNP